MLLRETAKRTFRFLLKENVQLGYGGRNTQEESFRTELFVRLSRLIHAAS